MKKAKKIKKTTWSLPKKGKKIVSLSAKKKTGVTLKGKKAGKTTLTAKVKVGKKTYKLKISRTPLTTVEKITYKSSNSKIASVNSQGMITARKKGTATITILSGKKKATVKVTVK